MNFKSQYKSTFSEIHASEEIIERICEVNDMVLINKTNSGKNKKIFMTLLAAAAFAAISAVSVSAGAADEISNAFRLFINGKEVSASDYVVYSSESNIDGKESENYVIVFNQDGDGIKTEVIYAELETGDEPLE